MVQSAKIFSHIDSVVCAANLPQSVVNNIQMRHIQPQW